MRLPFLIIKANDNFSLLALIGLVISVLLLLVFPKFIFGVVIGLIIGLPIGAFLQRISKNKHSKVS